MNMRWKKLLVRTTLWLAVELWLNFLGLDDVADYSEFIFERHVIVQSPLIFSLSREQSRKGVLGKAGAKRCEPTQIARPSEFLLMAASTIFL
jgi:hypothetical protein